MKRLLPMLLLLVTFSSQAQVPSFRIKDNSFSVLKKRNRPQIPEGNQSKNSRSVFLAIKKLEKKRIQNAIDSLDALNEKDLKKFEDEISAATSSLSQTQIKTIKEAVIARDQKVWSLEQKLDSIKDSNYNRNNYFYKTVGKAEAKGLKRRLDSLRIIYNRYMIDLDESASIYSANLDSTQIKLRRKFIATQKIEFPKIEAKIDSLNNAYNIDYLKYANSTFFMGPKNARAFFDILYNENGKRFNTLNSTGVQIGSNTGTIYSELVSGNLGIFRVNLSAAVSNSTADSLAVAQRDEAYQKLISNGGNTTLKFEYPAVFAHAKNNRYLLLTRLIAKGTADLPEFGSTTDDFAGSASAGIDLYADAALSNNKMRFFLHANYNQYLGNKMFRNNLGVSSRTFNFGQLTVGVVVSEVIKLSFIVTTFSSEKTLRNQELVAGGQVLH